METEEIRLIISFNAVPATSSYRVKPLTFGLIAELKLEYIKTEQIQNRIY